MPAEIKPNRNNFSEKIQSLVFIGMWYNNAIMITKRRGSGVTHQQIADKLGVSRQLVTHALNRTHRTRISKEMREKVEQAARELNYRPRARTTHNIGYVLPLDSSYLEAEHVMSLHVEKAARALGYRLVVMGVQGETDISSLSSTFNMQSVDGVISPRWFGGAMRSALPPDLPLVLVTDEYDIDEDVDVICIDAFTTLQSMTQYLIDRGHRRIGLIVGKGGIKQHHDIISGMQKAYEINNIPIQDICLVRGKSELVLRNILKKTNAPTAWLVSSATYAMVIMYGIYQQGLRVPEDISVMSFLDSPSFEAMPLALTATNINIAELAVSRLIQKLTEQEKTAFHQHLQADIIERDSVANSREVLSVGEIVL